jgi:hypothetical protein
MRCNAACHGLARQQDRQAANMSAAMPVVAWLGSQEELPLKDAHGCHLQLLAKGQLHVHVWRRVTWYCMQCVCDVCP